MGALRGMRGVGGVGGVCEMCMYFARRGVEGVGGEGGERMRGYEDKRIGFWFVLYQSCCILSISWYRVFVYGKSRIVCVFCRSQICLNITRFYKEQRRPSSGSAWPACPNTVNRSPIILAGGFNTISTAACQNRISTTYRLP